MAATYFDELALKFVLAEQDDSNQQMIIVEQAAQAIEHSTNKRIAVGQWVASVSRWMQSNGDDDLVARAKGLAFLASTLKVLSRRDDTLKTDQIKLLVTFFCSLFENDHKAGITAAARALRHLVEMKHFQPTLAREIIETACKLGDDFKLQLPATRLELYYLFRYLVEHHAMVYGLNSVYGASCGFMINLLGLCRSERDPENLITWFTILNLFFRNFNPPLEVVSEVFKAFSAYFPISLRPSATSTAVTTDNLKIALRYCFSAHHCVGTFAVPFLVEKLDRVDQTVTVKVDILQTLDACLTNYHDPKQSITPNADLIWSALKYEVRHGEVQDIIKATVQALTSLTTRLAGEDLQLFLDNAWRDLREDISDPNYTAQAGRLLVAIVGATPYSFAQLMPRAIDHIKTTVRQSNSALHKRHLFTLISSLVRLRFYLASDPDFNSYKSHDHVGLLADDLFGDSLFNELYLPLWEEDHATSAPVEYVAVLQEAMHGLGFLVGQKSSGREYSRRLCSDSTCEAIIRLLAKPIIVCPIEGPRYVDCVEERVPQDLLFAGEMALGHAVPLYPPAFQQLLLQFLDSVKSAYRRQPQSPDLIIQIRNVSFSLCLIIHPDVSEPVACWLYEAALINTFLQAIQWMLTERAEPMFLIVFIEVLHVTITQALKRAAVQDTGPKLTEDLFDFLTLRFDAVGVPRVDLNRIGKIEALESEEKGPNRPRRAYCLFVIAQLYRRFSAVPSSNGETSDEYAAAVLGEPFLTDDPTLTYKQDALLSQLGHLATSVVREFSEEEQAALGLDFDAFHLFHQKNGVTPGHTRMWWKPNPNNNYRTAPLTLGIVQGLWPQAIRKDIQVAAIYDAILALISVPMDCSPSTAATMDALLCVLANKLDARQNPLLSDRRMQIQRLFTARIQELLNHPGNIAWKPRIFRSALHYLAGDAICLYSGTDQNPLLDLILEEAPVDVMMGRQLAQSFGLLVIPRDGLSELNHAIRRKLSLVWVYHKAVQRYLPRCFEGGDVDEREATNRAVAVFSVLRHLVYAHYAEDIARIVRIGIRSLTTFRVGIETESLLCVLLCIHEENPDQLREHLATLIQGLTAIYEMARNVADAAQFRPAMELAGGKKTGKQYQVKGSDIDGRDHDPVPTRMYTLAFFEKIATGGAFDAHVLLPLRSGLLRPLAAACGDSVREIRRTALKARQAWQDLD
ncbi:Dos2-interacting transcription regulator of RNA-Pol-II-domain-containing protein [Xylaria sp. CBS 124048]|nr:Dos2-interacting transcription regulator of RNA-Pol-II-domain-containing protein [Xylaria sp. CBS 124048]